MLSETLAVSNVPTVVWVDEADRIVVPNWVAFSNDLFTEFHGLESGPALDAIRTWVRSDVVPAELAVDPSVIGDLSEDEESARFGLLGVAATNRATYGLVLRMAAAAASGLEGR